MHLPHNALPKNTAFCLDQIGMPNFTPIRLMADATCARAAHNTSQDWKEQLRLINLAREEHGPIAARTGKTTHGHKDSHRWATCAFVDNLNKAYAIEFPPPPKENHKRFSLQAHIQKNIAPYHYEHNLVNTTFHRLYKFTARLAINEEQLKCTMNLTVQAVKKLSPMFGAALLKTWTNGWITDSRVGASNASPCRFGCNPHNPNNTDRQLHYLECERLWKSIHRSYKKYANIQLTPSRFHALCIIPPWETDITDPKEITHHLVCLGAAVDIYNSLSNRQKLHAGKCHAKGRTRPHKVKKRTLEEEANEAFRRINRLKKIPKILPPNASTYGTDQGTDDCSSSTSSSSDSSSSTSSSDSNVSVLTNNDGQLRVTSSSQPSHDHEKGISRSAADEDKKPTKNSRTSTDKSSQPSTSNAYDGQLRVTSSSEPSHDHKKEKPRSAADERKKSTKASHTNDGQLRATSSSEPSYDHEKRTSRSAAEENNEPTKNSAQITRQYVQARLSPPTPLDGALNGSLFSFDASHLD
jgi:hypothetical protein